jgi:tetratricopeptide (TPR) repeat protein
MIENKQLITRAHKINEVLALADNISIFKIEAQAGQGKSVFASLLSEQLPGTSITYQVTEADKDPLHFYKQLYSKLSAETPSFSSPLFEQLLTQNALFVLEFRKYCQLIAEAILKSGTKLTLIIDDVHLLPDDGLGFFAVNELTGYAKNNFKAILCSRHKIPLTSNTKAHTIVESFLAIDEDEFIALSNIHLDWLHDFSSLEHIQKVTEGWMMGTRIIFEYMTANNLKHISEQNTVIDIINSYFSTAGSSSKIKSSANNFYMLSLLDDFHIDFVSVLPDSQKILNHIDEMLNKNFFIYKVADKRYRFHHLFCDYLRDVILAETSAKKRNAFYKKAADFEHKLHNHSKAIKYLILAEDFDALEAIIKDNYLEIIFSSDSEYMYEMLLNTDIANMPWASLMVGSNSTAFNNMTAENYLKQSASASSVVKDNLCQMIAIAYLVLFHCYHSSDFKTANNYLLLLKELYEKQKHPENDFFDHVLNTAMSAGSLFTAGRHDPLPYINRCAELHDKGGNQKTKINLLSQKIMYANFTADHETQNKCCNAFYIEFSSPLSTAVDKVYCIGHLLNHLAVFGNMHPFREQVFGYFDHMPSPLIKVFSLLWLLDNMVGDGKYDEVLTLTKTYGKTLPKPDHLWCQIEHICAIAEASRGNRQALDDIDKFIAKRQASFANEYFLSLSYSSAGQICTLLGEHEKAIEYANMALQEYNSASFDNKHYMVLCMAYHNLGDTESAELYAVKAINDLKRANATFSWTITKELAIPCLSYAVRIKDTKEYAEMIARDRYQIFFNNKNQPTPMLYIRTMSDIIISAGDTTVNTNQITRVFKNIIAFLINNNMSCSTEALTCELWADSPEEKARRSFDTNIYRLRATIKAELGLNPNDYIIIKNGVLSLENVICDIRELERHTAEAEISLAKKEYIDSMISFQKARNLVPSNIAADIDIAFANTLRRLIQLGVNHSVYFGDFLKVDDFIISNTKHVFHDQTTVEYIISYLKTHENKSAILSIISDYREYLRAHEVNEDEIGKTVFSIKKVKPLKLNN